MSVAKDIANKVFNYINPWGETLASVSSAIRASYHRTIQATKGQAVFGRYTVLNLTSVLDWRFITAGKNLSSFITIYLLIWIISE